VVSLKLFSRDFSRQFIDKLPYAAHDDRDSDSEFHVRVCCQADYRFKYVSHFDHIAPLPPCGMFKLYAL